jgi:hypothetical protein
VTRGLRALGLAACLALWLAAPGGAAPAAAAPDPARPRNAAEAAGAWSLSLDGTPRRCVVTLAGDAAAGQTVRFPAGCRRALPIVGRLARWRLEDGALRLLDEANAPVLDFALPETPGPLSAAAASGERYGIAPEGPRAAPPEPPPVIRAALPKPDPRPPATPPPEGVSGTYALDRFSEKDTCRLALDVGALRVLDGCRDLGLTVFDPVSWRYDEGRITLFARRGHSVGLVPFGDGRWRRDPETGTTFVLRRVAP